MVDKECTKCREVKPLDAFYAHPKGLHGKQSACAECQKAYRKKRYHSDIDKSREYYREREKVRPRGQKRRHSLWANYRLRESDLEKLIEAQDGKCGICATHFSGENGWHIDHDHACCPEARKSCGKCVRGLLCSTCNVGLGMFKDNRATLRNAIDYLGG